MALTLPRSELRDTVYVLLRERGGYRRYPSGKLVLFQDRKEAATEARSNETVVPLQLREY